MSLVRFLSFSSRFFSSSRFSNKSDLELWLLLLPMLFLTVVARIMVMVMGEVREVPRSPERALLWPVVIPNRAQVGAFVCFPNMVVGGVKAAATPSSLTFMGGCSTRISFENSTMLPSTAPSSLWMQQFASSSKISVPACRSGMVNLCLKSSVVNLCLKPAGLCWPVWMPSSTFVLYPLKCEQMSELPVCNSMEISVELQVSLNLHMRKGDSLKVVRRSCFSAFLGLIVHDACWSSEVAADNENEKWEAKMEACEANLANMNISNKWYVELNLHYAFIRETTDFSFQFVAFAALYWKCQKWNSMLSVNMRRQVNRTAEVLLDNFVHTKKLRFKSSISFRCAYMFNGSSFGGNTIVSEEQVSPTCFCCPRSASMDGFRIEDTVPVLFGLCHRRWTTSPSLLILRFDSGDTSSLSSVMAIQYLQLNALKPQVHTPERPLGESPTGHQLVCSTKEALGDCNCSKFKPKLSSDKRPLFDSNCSLRYLLCGYWSSRFFYMQLSTDGSSSVVSFVILYWDL